MKVTSDEDENEFLGYQKNADSAKNSETLGRTKQISSGEKLF